MRNAIILLVASLLPVFSIAQTIHGVILDQKTLNPISDAHILLENTAQQVYTNKDGQYELPNNTRGKSFIISHISYKLTSRDIPLEANAIDTIYLEQASEILQKVVITESRNDLKKERLKQFKKDLFESETIAESLHKKIELLNPEAIIFEQKGDTLVAYSDQLIRFRNKYLGYDMQLYLQDYMHTDDLAACIGRVFFENINQLVKRYDRPKYEERKKYIWRDSEQAFFQGLLQSDINLNHSYYERGQDGKTVYMENADKLYERVFKTKYEDIYAFLVPYNLVIKNGDQKSEIGSNTSVILFNDQGVVVNREDYIQKGFWLRKSLTEILPQSYCRSIKAYLNDRFTTKYDLATLRNKSLLIAQKVNSKSIQQIDLLTDKLIYDNNETLLVQAIVHDYQTGEPINSNELVYVDLIDENGKLVESLTRKLSDGYITAGIQLKDAANGKYCVRAYTDYMKSYGPKSYAYSTIAINLIPRGQAISADTAYASIYPEGNAIVDGSNSRLIFEFTDKHGREIPFEGILRDKSNDKSYVVKTITNGLALADVNITAASDLILESNSQHIVNASINIGDYFKEASIQVLDRNKYFRINVSSLDVNEAHKLIILHNGNNIHNEEIDINKKSIKIEKSYLPAGNILVALLNNNDEIISHRYIDNTSTENKWLTITPEYEYSYTGQAMKVGILHNITDSLQWNIRVAHEDYLLDNPIDKNQFIKHLYLIKRPIDIIDEYCLLDNIPKCTPNESLALHGYVTEAGTDTRVKSYVSLNSWSNNFYIEETISDNEGNFSFESIPYMENKSIILQGRVFDNDSDNPIKGSRKVDIHILPKDSLITYFEMDSLPHLVKAEDIEVDSTYEETFKNQVVLDEVSVKARTKKQSHNYNNVNLISKVDWIADDISALTLFTNLYPSANLKPSDKNPAEYLIFVRFPVDEFVPLVIIVNGSVKPTSTLKALYKGQIFSLSYYKGVLSIITNPGYKTREELETEKQGILVYQFPETNYLFNYRSHAPSAMNGSGLDDRSTLFWQSDFVLRPEEEKDINIITSQKEGNYKLIATSNHPRYGKIEQRYSILVKSDLE